MFSSCSQNKDIEPDYEVEIIPRNDTLYFGSMFDSYEYVGLSGAVVSQVSDIIRLDSILIIKCAVMAEDASPRPSVNIFSNDGKFLRPAVRIGRGPDEILTIENICYNKYTGTLDILGNYGQTIYKYDLKTCTLRKKIQLDKERIFVAEDICPIDESRYMVYRKYPYVDGDEYKLCVFNASSGETESEFLEMDEELAEKLTFGQSNNLFDAHGDIFFYEAFGQMIYSYNISEGNLVPHIGFKKNAYSVPDNILAKEYPDLRNLVKVLEESRYIWHHVNVYEYKQYLVSSYLCDGLIYCSIIDTDTMQEKSYSVINDNLVWGLSTDDTRGCYYLIGTDRDYMMFAVEPFVIKELIAQQGGEVLDNGIVKNRSWVMELPDDANPVILLMKAE